MQRYDVILLHQSFVESGELSFQLDFNFFSFSLGCPHPRANNNLIIIIISAQRDADTARALAVVRFGHRPLTRPLQTHKPTDRTDYNTLRRS